MYKRVEDYFIGRHLRATEDVFDQARVRTIFRFGLFFAVMFTLPVATDFILNYRKLVWFHLFDLAAMLSFPFMLKGIRNLNVPIGIFFILTTISSLVVFAMVNPNTIEPIGTVWLVFFAGMSALLLRGWLRVLYSCFLVWLPIVYVIINQSLHGALTITPILETNAEFPPIFLMFVPAALLVYVIWQHTLTMQVARVTITTQKNEIEDKNKDITDSITYARNLQEALLPSLEEVRKEFPKSEIFYQPKAIVAGDFYWMEKWNNKVFIAAADCTGHGVPGAMVSVVCSGALTRSVREFHLTDTGKILDHTRNLVLETFAKSGNAINDGMDISLLSVDRETGKVSWSGANNSLWIVCDEQLQVIRADKQPVGKNDAHQPFTTHSVQIPEGAAVYLITDGFADQFGGPQGKKFKYKQLEAFFLANHRLQLHQRMAKLKEVFAAWKGTLEQVEDVCISAIDF